jgi:ribosomal protein L11 methylase PrmA
MDRNLSDVLKSSFRDPAGFLFRSDGTLYRQINENYQSTYKALVKSGLFQYLFDRQLLVSHEEVDIPGQTADAFQILKPLELPVISYAYEWSISQLRDAALLTLELQEAAMAKGFSLKDASIYNVQFYQGRPIFIDTLSFETYQPEKPWVAYKQFCEHFLAPLALMSRTDISLNQLLVTNIDGIPLRVASRLLPLSTRFNFSLLVHIHLHAKAQARHSNKKVSTQRAFSEHALRALLDNLRSTIRKLRWHADGTEWNDYYESNNNYVASALTQKERIVEAFVQRVAPDSVWDLGANTGKFSRIAARDARYVCAWDIDPACVENNYQALKSGSQKNIYPLLLNLCNPSPAIGWSNVERFSFVERGGADLVLALGLVHHLAISNNLPLNRIASFLSTICSNLVIEFVPKSDSQVQKLLRSREDIFPEYQIESFESIFARYFNILAVERIESSERTLYLLEALKTSPEQSFAA